MSSQQMNRSSIRRTNPRTRPYYYRRCKGGNFTAIDSLPDELLLEILVRISAEDLHENARIVCKRWNRMINGDDFVYAHLHRTSYGLLSSRSSLTFVAARQGGGVDVSMLSCKLTIPIECSCNGLIMGMDFYKRPLLLSIVNPATKRRFDLPQLFSTALLCSFGIGYAAATMEYKAVATYVHDSGSKGVQCAILTVGVDKAWRHVMTQQLSKEASKLLNLRTLITEGFMHWACCNENNVLTMNVDTEVIAETPAPLAPEEYQVQGFKYLYLSTGRNLSALVACGKVSWDVWELKGETGEWSKSMLPNIDCKCKTQQFGWKDNVLPLKPVGWVKYPEVLLFSYDGSCLICDLVNGEMESVELAPPMIREAVVHMRSLVCLS